MDAGRVTSGVAVVGILVLSVVGGPVAGAFAFEGPASEDALGDGTATVEDVTVSAERLRLTPGRFGTGVVYLRVPPATVVFDDISGESRIVYTVRVPGLSFERVATTRLSEGTGSKRTLEMSDRAFQTDKIGRTRYRANVTVRIQSFAIDRRVYARNVTVEVVR